MKAAKNVKVPNPRKPHLHKMGGYWYLEPAQKGCLGAQWEQAHFWRHRMNNSINNAFFGASREQSDSDSEWAEEQLAPCEEYEWPLAPSPRTASKEFAGVCALALIIASGVALLAAIVKVSTGG